MALEVQRGPNAVEIFADPEDGQRALDERLVLLEISVRALQRQVRALQGEVAEGGEYVADSMERDLCDFFCESCGIRARNAAHY